MSNKVISNLGTEVDFDLLKIKQQMVTPKTIEVENRERFIDAKKRRRSGVKKTVGVTADTAPQDKTPKTLVVEDAKEVKDVKVEKVTEIVEDGEDVKAKKAK